MYAYTTGTLGTLQDTITYSYGNTGWKDQLTNYDGTAISYDASGNPTNWIGNLNTLTWTGRQLSSIAMPNNQSINFKYNSDGIRTYKYFIDNDEMYLYQHDYMLEGSTIVGEKVYYFSYYNGSWTKYKYYYYDENGSPIGMGYEGKDYYFQKNILGDIEAIYQGSTKVVQYTYDAWGNILSVTGTLASTIGQENPFRYRGYYYDTETGLYYLQSRYYDPQVGRFINADEPATLFFKTESLIQYNLYTYCWNNYVNMFDSKGVWPTVTWKKTSNFMSFEIKVPWKDIELYYKILSYKYCVEGIIACFIPEPAVSKAIGVAFGSASLVSALISDVIATKKSGQSIRIGISFNYKIVVNKAYVYIVNTRWIKIGFWSIYKTAKLSNIKWWVKL